jgi:hypothetical protein
MIMARRRTGMATSMLMGTMAMKMMVKRKIQT